MYGLSNDENIFDLWCPLKVKGQGQTLKTLKSNISETVRDRDSRLRSFEGMILTFDLWRSPEVKNIFTIFENIFDLW